MQVRPTVIGSLLGCLALGLAAGFYLSRWSTKASTIDCSAGAKAEQLAETVVSTSTETLNIYRELFTPADHSNGPSGYRIRMTGAVNQSFLLTQELDEQTRKDFPLLDGQVVQKDEYTWAGLRTLVLFVKQGDRLQIQREFEPEDAADTAALDGEANREVLWEMELPKGTPVVFK